ncbi:MAG TPA: transketolase C-terminal domain-containing protein [Turneriella sp.]|nr:transketolase C-terminal domain-containing protein [Turneriella sp.]HNL55082.1 transketolase C-terminal domain-containing protein [Turneriella sp.]HNN00147.1 transketolase C-terminal domain-containing protein [Turneriella sp.]
MTDVLAPNLEKKATRDGYGAALVEIGASNPKVVVLDADLSGSTKTKKFSEKYPDRFFNYGVAEQNLVGQAAGFALSGLIPVASSFAMFAAGRAWEIFRNSVCYPHLNVKVAATHAGITLGEDGASHQIIEDLALTRVMPGLAVLVPSDYNQAAAAIKTAVAFDGPVYLRLGRPNVPSIYSADDVVRVGGSNVLQTGSKAVFIAAGVMVFEAWKAAALIEKETGTKVTVIDAYSVKPLDEATILKATADAQLVVTFEEHNILAGLGGAVAELLAEKQPRRVHRIGLRDEFGQSGDSATLMKHYKLTAETMLPDLLALLKAI